MNHRMIMLSLVAVAAVLTGTLAQNAAPRGSQRAAAATLPTVETVPLLLTDPTNYRVSAVLEPARTLFLRATDEGFVREIAVQPGDRVEQAELVARLDPAKAQARFRLAEAQLKEAKATLKTKPDDAAKARIEATEAALELARADLAATNLNAPFEGQVLAVSVTPGQFVLKGESIATIADTSSLRAVVPVDRAAVKTGQTITLSVEGQNLDGQVTAILPLPESFAVLRQLAAPFAAATVAVPNPKGELPVGFRVESPFIPNAPLAVVEDRAVKRYANGTAGVQVLRNERVTTVSVRVLGGAGEQRTQISGPFISTDALILSASVPLTDGTIVRFDAGASAPGTFNPDVTPVGGQGAGAKPETKSAPRSAPAKDGVPF